MVTGKDLLPAEVAPGMDALNVNVFPFGAKACVADPPIDVRSAVTARPVLGGFCPGVTVTVSCVDAPAFTDAGLAEAEPVGLVGSA